MWKTETRYHHRYKEGIVWSIELYREDSGEVPAYVWLQGLPLVHRVGALWSLDLLPMFIGEEMHNPTIRSLGKGLYEYKMEPDRCVADEENRVIYFRDDAERRLIVLHGFTMHNQVSLRQERGKARKRLGEYQQQLRQGVYSTGKIRTHQLLQELIDSGTTQPDG